MPFSYVLLLGMVQILIYWSRPTFKHPSSIKGSKISFCMFMLVWSFYMLLCVPFLKSIFVIPCLDVSCLDPCSFFRSLLVCLDLSSCILVLLHMLRFPFSMCLLSFCASLFCLVAFFSFFLHGHACLVFLHAFVYSFSQIYLCDTMFGCFMLRSVFFLQIFACMLRSQFLHPCFASHASFPFQYVFVGLLCLCFVWLHSSPFVACMGATMWVRLHLDDVGMLSACLFLSLSFACQCFFWQPYMCLIT